MFNRFSPTLPSNLGARTLPVYILKKPYEYFKERLDDSFFEHVAQMTNMKGVLISGKSFETNCDEIKTFFGCSIYTTIIGYPRLKMFWAARTRISMVADYISRDRFIQLRVNLKVVDDNSVSEEDRKSDRFWKVRPMLNVVRDSCLNTPRSQNISIDEQMIPFHGHVAMRQYIRGKPCPVGLKVFVMTSASGLPLDFVMYQGKGTSFESTVANISQNLHVGGKAVLTLCDTLPAGSSIYIDRFFTSEPLLDELLHRNILASGTIMLSRIPKNITFLKDSLMKKKGRGTHDQVVRKDGKVSVVKWFDNRGIFLASTEFGVQPEGECRRWSKGEKKYITIKRPSLVDKYNTNMGGVDMLDRVIAKYAMRTRTNKWTIRTIFHFFDFCLAAAWLEYRDQARHPNSGLGKKDVLDYFHFRLNVAENLIHSDSGTASRQPEVVESTDEEDQDGEDHFSSVNKRRRIIPIPHEAARQTMHLPENMSDKQKNRSKCRLQNCKGLTFVRCSTCKVFLCFNNDRNCYMKFHK